MEAHIYLTILTYQLINTIRYMLHNTKNTYNWQNVIRIMSTQAIKTVNHPTDKNVIHLRKPAKPIEEVQQIYNATNCTNT